MLVEHGLWSEGCGAMTQKQARKSRRA